MRPNDLAIPFLMLALSFLPNRSSPASERPIEIKVAQAGTEQQERNVDQVALSSQDLAISRLVSLLKKYQNNSTQEPILLAKLAEIQQQKAAILFRLAHAEAHRNRKALNLSKHHQEMNHSIQTLDRLIAHYPRFEEISHAWFLRGKAYEEMEKKTEAEKNYLQLVAIFPNADEITNAYMSLAEFSIDAGNHARAINFLTAVEKRPEDPHFPFALYKLAWAHYNLKNIPQALSYAERQISFYNERKSRTETNFTSESDLALRENTLLDTTVFYFEGFEQKLAKYSISEAMNYFKGLEQGPLLGKMFLRFAKLLRSHDREIDLLEWKKQTVTSYSQLPESLDVVMLTYEFELNHRHYDQVVNCAHDMVQLYSTNKTHASFPKAQKQLLDTAEGLQNLIVKNKGANQVGDYSRILAQLYESFVHVVEETDPRIPRAHYNLAETLFTIQDYLGATEHYRWVVDHGKWTAPDSVTEASLKAIASRYEVLRSKDLIPKELKAHALPQNESKNELPPLLAQWIQWIDTHIQHLTTQQLSNETETFIFEANRALYQHGNFQQAIQRMTQFALRYPKSKYAIPQASLILDTYIASENWEQTHELATDLLDLPEWKTGDFSKRLYVVAADAFYKQLEIRFHARDFISTLKGCDEFLEKYSQSPRLADTLALAGTAALENIERLRAQTYFSRLLTEAPLSSNAPAALLARGTLYEDRYEFTAAAADYRAYVAASEPKITDTKSRDEIRRKALALTWLAGDSHLLQSALNQPTLCVPTLAMECEKYQILLSLDSFNPENTQKAFEKVRQESNGNHSLWALLALEDAKNLTFHDRNIALRRAISGWKTVDPLIKFTLLPRLTRSLTKTFALNRAALTQLAPLRADEKHITRRIEVIREMENTATEALQLPWSRIRAEVLNEIAGTYLDLSQNLAALPAPKGLNAAETQAYEDTLRRLILPFEEKGQDMRAKAFEIGSRFAIEDEALNAISQPFFAENPSQAKALRKSRLPGSQPQALELNILEHIDLGGGWAPLISNSSGSLSEKQAYENPAQYIKSLWIRAYKAHHLPQVAFFMQEAQEKALIQAGVMNAVKALSMNQAGARGEGLAELNDARQDLKANAKNLITRLLVRFYQNSYAHEKAQSLARDLDSPLAQR
ncbi:tetratricopeptide repeat protein [Bdellovibrionota bacterium FG-1]